MVETGDIVGEVRCDAGREEQRQGKKDRAGEEKKRQGLDEREREHKDVRKAYLFVE